ncbi:PLD nuclease N-terminal domain-containing protein [Salinimicrobium sp. HB62]|uniref:PLD nuclease N-terminal domain-containing protein n=1 Tax=Salinimicrobium sp. HB62 TaxID=3077781 RepID=UPI003A7F30CA
METFFLLDFVLIFIAFWGWALLDLIFSNFRRSRWKIAWFLVIVFFPVVGSMLYFLLRKDFQLKRGRIFQPYFRPGAKK